MTLLFLFSLVPGPKPPSVCFSRRFYSSAVTPILVSGPSCFFFPLFFELSPVFSLPKTLLCTTIFELLGKFRIFARIHPNGMPCSGFVKKFPNISCVELYVTLTYPFLILSVIKNILCPDSVFFCCCTSCHFWPIGHAFVVLVDCCCRHG